MKWNPIAAPPSYTLRRLRLWNSATNDDYSGIYREGKGFLLLADDGYESPAGEVYTHWIKLGPPQTPAQMRAARIDQLIIDNSTGES